MYWFLKFQIKPWKPIAYVFEIFLASEIAFVVHHIIANSGVRTHKATEKILLSLIASYKFIFFR